MATKEPKRISYLIGPREGGPSFEDLIALYRAITGREPTEQDRADAAAIIGTIDQGSQA